jgi:signal transduction histidine kinase
VRLAAIQVLVVLIAFGVAGLMSRAGVRAANEATLRREIQGEMTSLQDEILRFGEPRLGGTVDRRTRLWRGFEYGLQGPRGDHLAGRLRPPPGRFGWTELRQAGASGRPESYLVYVRRTPGGERLAVGKDLAGVQLELRLVTRRLIAAGACGALVCLAVWGLFVRSTWRRLAKIADAAHLVAEGRLNVRVPAGSRRSPDDIDELGVALNTMLDRIGGLVGQLRRMTTEVAHDLRTPLTRVRQKLEHLEAAPDLPAPRRLQVAQVQADIRELLRTFDALLQLAEIEGQSPADEGAVFDLADVAQRLADAFRPDIEESGRRLVIDTAPAAVSGDVALVTQMLANLIENALRHTPVGSTMQISVAALDEGARLTVADDGPGIPAHMREAVLAPYVRLDESRHTPGSGVGLAIVAAVAARHRTRLTLEDNGPGLRVVADFPPAKGKSPPAARIAAAPARNAARAERLSRAAAARSGRAPQG